MIKIFQMSGRKYYGPRTNDILYDESAKKMHCDRTGNKTEILLGYSTIFGDSASAINPIGDLYKTQLKI